MIRALGLCSILLCAVDLDAARITGFAAGFANSTSGFWGIEYLSNQSADAAIATVTLRMPGSGFFDFDGLDNYAGQTAPLFDVASSSGVNAADVSFLFSGSHPIELTLQFGSGSFTPGDRLQFAADIDGLGSKLGGALGAYEGVGMTVLLADGRSGSGNFRTDTSVRSVTTIEILPAEVPEPDAFVLAGAGLTVVWLRRMRAH